LSGFLAASTWPGKQPNMADEKVCDPTSASIKSGEPADASCLEFVTRRRSPHAKLVAAPAKSSPKRLTERLPWLQIVYSVETPARSTTNGRD
jgi:hypothetical protein